MDFRTGASREEGELSRQWHGQKRDQPVVNLPGLLACNPAAEAQPRPLTPRLASPTAPPIAPRAGRKMSLEDADHAGWVYKQGSLVRNWKKRFMVLHGRQLTYYDTARLTPSVKAKGSFTLITVELSTEIQNGLLVHGRGGRVLKLYTDSAESTSMWYNRIMEATAAPGNVDRRSLMVSDRYSSLASSSMPSGGASVDLDEELSFLDRIESLPLDDNVVTHSGWLKKEGSRVKSWKRRFFALRGDALSYFDSEDTGAAAKGYGHIKTVEVNDQVANGLDVTFDNGRVLRVSAKTRPDMELWLCKLSDAIEQSNADRANVRQSMAAQRSSFRASMPGTMLKQQQQQQMQMQANNQMRHSLAGVPSRPMGNMSSNVDPAKARYLAASYTQASALDKRQPSSDDGSYLSSMSSTLSTLRDHPGGSTSFVETDSDEYLSDESEGDWI